MHVVKKLGLGLLAVTITIVLLALMSIAHNAYVPSRPIGMQQVLVQSPGYAPIQTTIWYPSSGSPRWTWTGLWAAKLVSDGQIDGTKLPLVVISHGTGGTAFSHLDTALALAQSGYVVAAPLHPGDNYRDDALVGKPGWFKSRTNDIRRIDDYMIRQWSERSHIDPDKLGFFGFSAGGTTGLIAIGGEPDLGLIRAHCAAHPEFVCSLLRPPAREKAQAPTGWTHDTRLKAAVIIAPGLGFAFPRSSLSNVSAPVQLWDGDRDTEVPLTTNADVIAANLPVHPEFHVVAGAGHFSFLPPCGVMSIALPKMLCRDEPGFDRKAFHHSLDAAVVRFFDQQFEHQ